MGISCSMQQATLNSVGSIFYLCPLVRLLAKPSSSAEVLIRYRQYTIDQCGLVYAVRVDQYCRRSTCQ